MVIVGEFGERRAPYAPISALQQFLERMGERAVPEAIDHRFLKKLSVASNNEYALLSALKFLGIIDPRGRPTTSYRALQTVDGFKEALRRLVEQAYKPAFEAGAGDMRNEELIDYFKRESSPSQARNAARFFRAVCRLSGKDLERGAIRSHAKRSTTTTRGQSAQAIPGVLEATESNRHLLLEIKSRLLEKLPAPSPNWSAAEYQATCDRFLAMLESLDRSL